MAKLSVSALKRIFIVLPLIGFIFAIAFFLWWKKRNVEITPILSSGGDNLDIILPVKEYYSQNDTRWSNKTIGGSNERVGDVGCTISSVAMAMTSLTDKINPGQLNEKLKEVGGYTTQGWLIWKAINKVNTNIKIEVISQPTFKVLDQSLQSGNYPVIKFWLQGGIPHWVILMGKKNNQYFVLDPLGNSQYKILSTLTNKIYSIRIIKSTNKTVYPTPTNSVSF